MMNTEVLFLPANRLSQVKFGPNIATIISNQRDSPHKISMLTLLWQKIVHFG
jgi:hypothetical protein